VGTSVASEIWRTIAQDAIAESKLWGDLLRPESEREYEPVFSQLTEDRYALGLETIYEGYLVHYGTSRLFAPADEDTALLLGDYLYAHGLVRIAACGEVDAVADLAELISLSSQLRAEGTDGDAALWAATASLLGAGRELDAARAALRLRGDAGPLDEVARTAAGSESVDRSVAAHDGRLR
jgi:hypothetical protein